MSIRVSATPDSTEAPALSSPIARSRSRGLLVRLRRNPRAVGGGAVLVVVVALVSASMLAPYSPGDLAPLSRLSPPLAVSLDGRYHLLGTDQLGRDVLSRLLFGGRMSLLVAAAAVLLSGSAGVALGLVAGYFGGWLDALVSRIADVQLSMPTVILAIGIAAALGPSAVNVVLVLAVASWVIFFRTVRASTLTLRRGPLVEAARSLGATDGRILLRHILLNSWTPVIVVATQQAALIILLEASLSFLGVGIPIETPTWGGMINEGRAYILTNAWWVTLFPGAAISITVLAFNFFGDGLRDALDPRL